MTGWGDIDFGSDTWFDDQIAEAEKETQYDYGNPWEETLLDPKIEGIYFWRMYPIMKGSKEKFFRQFGEHWGIFPNDVEGLPRVVPCPKISWGQRCKICEAIDAAIANKLAPRSELYGWGKVGVRKRFLIKGLLLRFATEDKTFDSSVLPDLPAIRVMIVPATVHKGITDLAKRNSLGLEDENEGPISVFHPLQGSALRIERNEKLDKKWSVKLMRNPWPIPEEYADPSLWPALDDFVPKINSAEVNKLLMENMDDLPEILARSMDHLHAIDVGPNRPVAALPSAEEVPPPSDKDAPDWGKGFDEELQNI